MEAFLYRHDLSSMKHGAGLPEMYLLRQGGKYRIETGGRVFDWPGFIEVSSGLERLGTLARDLLAASKGGHERIISRWDMRNDCDSTAAAALITGVNAVEITRERVALSPLLDTLAGRGIWDIANDNAAPMLAVARSSGGLGPTGIAEMIRAFRRLPAGSTEQLRRRRAEVKAAIRHVRGATDQGIGAASNVREWIQQPIAAPVDLDRLCIGLGIAVQYEESLDSRIDGLASNGPENGPAILLNLNTARRGGTKDDLDRSMRFTLAHELGHLLLDDSEWPAITDAVQQRVPRVIETRANAFATYLLVPADEAYAQFDMRRPSMTWSSVEQALNLVGGLFQVPRILVSRQIFRGAPLDRKKTLKRLFSDNIFNF